MPKIVSGPERLTIEQHYNVRVDGDGNIFFAFSAATQLLAWAGASNTTISSDTWVAATCIAQRTKEARSQLVAQYNRLFPSDKNVLHADACDVWLMCFSSAGINIGLIDQWGAPLLPVLERFTRFVDGENVLRGETTIKRGKLVSYACQGHYAHGHFLNKNCVYREQSRWGTPKVIARRPIFADLRTLDITGAYIEQGFIDIPNGAVLRWIEHIRADHNTGHPVSFKPASLENPTLRHVIITTRDMHDYLFSGNNRFNLKATYLLTAVNLYPRRWAQLASWHKYQSKAQMPLWRQRLEQLGNKWSLSEYLPAIDSVCHRLSILSNKVPNIRPADDVSETDVVGVNQKRTYDHYPMNIRSGMSARALTPLVSQQNQRAMRITKTSVPTQQPTPPSVPVARKSRQNKSASGPFRFQGKRFSLGPFMRSVCTWLLVQSHPDPRSVNTTRSLIGNPMTAVAPLTPVMPSPSDVLPMYNRWQRSKLELPSRRVLPMPSKQRGLRLRVKRP